MQQEETIREELAGKLNLDESAVKVLRARRLSCEVALKDFSKAFEIVIKELRFNVLCAITGLDETEKLGVIYHLANDQGIVLNLKTHVDKNNPVIKTITPHFSSADIYERELVDLFGFKVEGLSAGNRYPLTDDWPVGEYPLRKEWNRK